MKVSAIVVTFNRVKILKTCLKYLLLQNYELNNIIVINNASTDGTKNYLNHLHDKKIIVKNMHKNVGGSGGFSEGIRIAYEKTNSEYFWVMDDDSIPTSDSLEKLIFASKKLRNNFGFLCSNVRSKNHIPVNIPIVSKYWTESLPSNLIRVKEASFVSLFFSRNIVQQVGLPVRQMFIWGDDYEYTLRISKRYKHKGYLVSNSIVIHNAVASKKGTDKEESVFNTNRIKFFEYSCRNYLYLSRKYYGFKGVIKRLLGDLLRFAEIPFLSKNKRLERCFYTSIGMVKGLFFNPKIEFPSKSKDQE